MKKSQLRQIIKEELKSVMNEGFLDTIPYVKDVRAKNRAEEERKASEEAAYVKDFADRFVADLERAYNRIGKYIQNSDKWTDSHKATLQRELDVQMYRLVMHDDTGEVPENPIIDFDPDKTDIGTIPPYAMNDVMKDLNNILK